MKSRGNKAEGLRLERVRASPLWHGHLIEGNAGLLLGGWPVRRGSNPRPSA